jgi:4-hydroxy-2-oxoheptanedioate aldolase
MDLPPNPFRVALQRPGPRWGVWCTIPGPVVSELLAGAGFDWITLDCEHSLTDIPDLMAMLQAVAPYPVAPVVRPAANDAVLIKRVLDLGAQTLLLPYVETAAEAEAAVRATRYAPRGIRGVSGATRASRFGAVADYVQRADDEIVVIVQVETVAALARIEEIAAVDGVDALFVGPSDLAASMGLKGQPGHPDVRAAVLDAIRRIAATGRAAGTLSFDPAFAREAAAAGARFVAIGYDMGFLTQGARSLLASFR